MSPLRALAFVVAFGLLAARVNAQTLRIFHIDVESADAALFVMPNGKTLLIDSGGNGKGPRILKAMSDAGVSTIDVFVNSHYHEDHFGGIDEVVDAGTVRTVGEDARPLRPGDTIPLDPLVTITVIGSSGRVIGDTAPVNHCHENDLSVSLLISYAGFKAFFGGDTEKTRRQRLPPGIWS
jgi:competence protein ComEC